MKRTIDLVEDICAEMRPVKRLSMLHNTPKQWKEQRKWVLRMSRNKLQQINDVERDLRRSVQLNNTYRKMRRGLRENFPYSPPAPSLPLFMDVTSAPEEAPPRRSRAVADLTRSFDATRQLRRQTRIEEEEEPVAMDTSGHESRDVSEQLTSLRDVTQDVDGQSEDVDVESIAMETTSTEAAASSSDVITLDDVTLQQAQPIDFSLKRDVRRQTDTSAGADGQTVKVDFVEEVRSSIDRETLRATPNCAEKATLTQGHSSSSTTTTDPESNDTTAGDHQHQGHATLSGQQVDQGSVTSRTSFVTSDSDESFDVVFLRSPLGRSDPDDADVIDTDLTSSLSNTEGQSESGEDISGANCVLDLSSTAASKAHQDLTMTSSDDSESVTSPASSTCSECESEASSCDDVTNANNDMTSWRKNSSCLSCSFQQHFSSCGRVSAAMLACS